MVMYQTLLSSKGESGRDAPLSIYIYIPCVEALTALINYVVSQGKLAAIPINRGGPVVSHLMFVDDLVICGQANEEEILQLLSILQDFEVMSGQAVNKSKSEVMFSRNIQPEIDKKLCQISGFSMATKWDLYLGILWTLLVVRIYNMTI